MSANDALRRMLFDKVKLTRLGEESTEAGLLLCSLPVPRGTSGPITISGRATHGRALGKWPGTGDPGPRRMLLIADGGPKAPDAISVGIQATAPGQTPPEAVFEQFAVSDDPAFMWERHLLRVKWGGRTVGLAMGMRVGAEVHWWEQCRMVTRHSDETCLEVEIGGAIPYEVTTGADVAQGGPYYTFPLLHRHNWLSGSIQARLHANGVCEIFAHHINNKYVDDGLDLKDAVPVIGIRVEEGGDDGTSLEGAWDGTRDEFSLNDVRYSVRDVAPLATPEHPGSMVRDGDWMVWQPYEAMELFGGLCPKARSDDGFILHAKDRTILRGMARTLRFSFSLNPDRAPRVARYLAPPWWYGLCEEIVPAPLLPVHNEYDVSLDACRAWVRQAVYKGGFEDGSIPRGDGGAGDKPEPGWEGEVPYAQILAAWLSGNAEDYGIGLRACYHFADVAVDHAACAVRMHGFPPNAIALPMERIHAAVMAYLETGDHYLLNTARSLIDNAYWRHKNSWPRMTVGRDACFIRGQVFMYRYFGDEHYRELAWDSAQDVAASQMETGCFGDQGGGTGIHGSNGYVVKPWMGLMAVGGLIDYLEVVGDDPRIEETVRKFADWLMRERRPHEGRMGWRYQHYYAGKETYYSHSSGKWIDLTTSHLWHVDYLARLLTFSALRFGDASYFDAWAESYGAWPDGRKGDHACAQSYQYLPWVQAKLWGAVVDEQGGVEAHPIHLGARTPRDGTVLAPDGPLALCWSDDGKVGRPEGVEIKLSPTKLAVS